MPQGIFDMPVPGQQPPVKQPVPEPQRPQEAKMEFNPYGDAPQVDEALLIKAKDQIDGRDVKEQIEKAETFSDDDIRIAESVLFRGWADTQVPIVGGRHTATLSTTIPLELDLVDEIVSDWLHAESSRSTSPIADSTVSSKQKTLSIATYFTGFDGVDICKQPELRLDTIKNGIMALSRAMTAGDIEAMTKHKAGIKDLLSKRASYIVSTMNTMVLDMITSAKVEFESRVMAILEAKTLLPK